MAISENAFQAFQNENMDIVEVDVDPFASAAVAPTSEIVSDNDDFETNADDEEDDEFTSSSDIGSENEFEGRGNPEDEDVEDSPQHPEDTSTTGRGTLSHRATSTHPDGRHPAHSPGAGDEHTSTSRRLPAPHRLSSARSSSSRLRSSVPQPLEEIPDFFRPPTAPTDGENPLTYLIAEHGLLHPSSVVEKKMSLVFKSGYLKQGWKWKYVFFTWDLPMSFAIYDAWCRRASIRYTGNIYLIAKKRITPIYLTEEVFEHYKRMRATDETFKKKSEQMSSNRKSEVGGPGTGISLHSAGSISARQHGDTLEKKLQRRPTWKEMFRHLHTHGHDVQSFVDQRSAKIDTPDTSIDEDVVYLEVVPEVKGRVYGLGSQGYHRSISLGGASLSRGPAYGLHELVELQRDHQRPHLPPTPRTPPSLGTERSGPQSDDHPGHLTTEITPSQSAHPQDHRSGHWTSPHRRMSEDQRHLLDDHDEFMEQLMSPPRPPPREE
ncbi:hypothetical protein Syun_029644 [Stephania yunnanensis]|uniref:Uncharacterized protein n=1 Tax=Stephania yunnanensis TaxID=152371 RepID=A0AAP0E5S4_9MAGN